MRSSNREKIIKVIVTRNGVNLKRKQELLHNLYPYLRKIELSVAYFTAGNVLLLF